MLQKKKLFVSLLALLFLVFASYQTTFASNTALKAGMSGSSVTRLQKDLKALGFMSVDATGYFGDVTNDAVIKFQKKYGLTPDGIAGTQTLDKIDKMMGRKATVSRSIQGSLSIVDYAKKFLGVGYVWGGTTSKGFDCSGFVKYIFKNFGVTLSRTSSSQANQGSKVKKENLLPGDMVFFDTNGGHNYINHVGMYIGGGKFIHASSGHSGVVISDITEGFYARTYMTARRVLR